MGAGGCGSPVRGVFAGGNTSPTPSITNLIDYVTIATLGDALDFGDLRVITHYAGALSSSVRGVWAGGSPGGNVINYVTITTLGDALDFGDLAESKKLHLEHLIQFVG